MTKHWSINRGPGLRIQRLTSPIGVNASLPDITLGRNLGALHALAWLLLCSTGRLQWLLVQVLILNVLPMTLNSMLE